MRGKNKTSRLRLRFPVKGGQDGDLGSDEVQYLFTRFRSVDIEEVEMRAVAMKLELDADEEMQDVLHTEAGPSAIAPQSDSKLE